MRNNKKLIILMSLILVILIGVAVVLFTKGDSDKDGSKEQVTTQEDNPSEDVISTVEQQIEEEESYVVETDYVRLYFPQKWEANLETEIVEEDGYIIEFYGKVEGKDRQKIFDVVFNGDAENMVGMVDVNGEAVYVGFNFAEPEIGEDWSGEEEDMIYAMQEDVNYLIGMLEREAGFVAE